MRDHQLATEPLCRFCLITEDVTAAEVVDHITPHKGDLDLFYNPLNLQSLCKYCHDGLKQRIDRGAAAVITGLDGYPIEIW